MKFFTILSTVLVFAVFALPQPEELSSQVKRADVIVFADIKQTGISEISAGMVSVNLKAEVIRVYKSRTPIKVKFNLAFMTFPEYLGKYLQNAPEEGKYILFLNYVKSGNFPEILALQTPHPYAIREWNPELENKITSYTEANQ